MYYTLLWNFLSNYLLSEIEDSHKEPASDSLSCILWQLKNRNPVREFRFFFILWPYTNDWLNDKEMGYDENNICRIQSTTKQHWHLYKCWLYASLHTGCLIKFIIIDEKSVAFCQKYKTFWNQVLLIPVMILRISQQYLLSLIPYSFYQRFLFQITA